MRRVPVVLMKSKKLLTERNVELPLRKDVLTKDRNVGVLRERKVDMLSLKMRM